jgi:hypothetical protein
MENENPDWWKTHKLPASFKKHANETVYLILINDYSYIKWLDGLKLDRETRAAVDKAIEHHNIHFAY